MAHLLDAWQIIVFLPLLLERRRFEPLFPGYLFLKIDTKADEYLRCRSAPGVAYIINSQGVPVPVAEGLVEEIKRRLRVENSLCPAERFAPGERVLVTAGPFRDVEAVFDRSLTPRGRCLVLLQMLGRLTRVQVDAAHLARAEAGRCLRPRA